MEKPNRATEERTKETERKKLKNRGEGKRERERNSQIGRGNS